MVQDALYSISLFVRVAEAKSFTKAAERLGISPSAVSKGVTRLEERLGVRLANRTTRSVSLTEDGAAFFERCRQILGEIEDAETAVMRTRTKPTGRLRVLMPVGFGLKVLAPLLPRFSAAYPDLTVDVEFSDRVADLAQEGIDAAVRVGEPGDTSLVVRKLCDLRYVPVASPAYLQRWGEPQTPQDLKRHNCLQYHIPQTNRYREWRFVASHESVPVSGRLNMNSGGALVDAAIAGAGIAVVATFMAYDAVRAGKLRVLLPEHASMGSPVWVGYLQRRHLSLRIRAFVDFLVTHIPASSTWDAILRDGKPSPLVEALQWHTQREA